VALEPPPPSPVSRARVGLGVALALVAPLAVAWWWPARVPHAGGLFQLVGLVIVASGLVNTRNRLRGTTLREELFQLGRRLRRWLRTVGKRRVEATGTAHFEILAADLTGTVQGPPTLGEAVAELTAAQRRAKERMDRLEKALDDELVRRVEAVREVGRLVENLASAGLRVETVGVAWLASGLLTATFPELVVRVAGWLASIPASLAAPFTG
jgi:hypothetical protein